MTDLNSTKFKHLTLEDRTEMDTVIVRVGGKIIMTFDFTLGNFMLRGVRIYEQIT